MRPIREVSDEPLPPTRRVRRRVALVLVSMLGVAACGANSGDDPVAAGATDSAATERGDPGYVGRVEGTDAFVAIVSGGGEAVVYVCDGDADIAEWFTGPTGDDGAFDLSNAAGAAVRGDLVDGRFEGVVTLSGGDEHPFTAEAAGENGALFRVRGPEADAADVVAGWIVDRDGAQRGSLRIRGVRRPAPALPGRTLDVAGAKYPVVVFFTPPTAPAGPGSGLPIPYPNDSGVVASG